MRIELTVDVLQKFHTSLREAGSREIGGMLLAEQLAAGDFRIIDFSLDVSSGSHTAFRRDPQSHQNTLDEFFRRTGSQFQRFNYLGEWHSHPSFSVRPSAQDIITMRDIVENQNSLISFAVLLIVRLRFRLWIEHSLTIFARHRTPEWKGMSRRVVWI